MIPAAELGPSMGSGGAFVVGSWFVIGKTAHDALGATKVGDRSAFFCFSTDNQIAASPTNPVLCL